MEAQTGNLGKPDFVFRRERVVILWTGASGTGVIAATEHLAPIKNIGAANFGEISAGTKLSQVVSSGWAGGSSAFGNMT